MPLLITHEDIGPVYREGDVSQEALLGSCYTSALDIALSMKLGSVAFPLISSGIYGYPKPDALRIAMNTIRDWLDAHGDSLAVRLCLVEGTLYEEAVRLARADP